MAWIYFRKLFSRGILGVMVLISVCGIIICVASLVVTLSVMNGFHTEISNKLLKLNPHIIVTNPFLGYELTQEKEELFDEHQEITGYFSFIFGNGLLHKENRSQGAVIKGVYGSDAVQHELTKGDWSDFKENSIVVGREIAGAMRVDVGDKMLLVIPSVEGHLTAPMVPRVEEFYVAGIFSTGIHEYDTGMAYINIEKAAMLFEEDQGSAGIDLYVENPFDAGNVASYLNDNLEGAYNVQTWKERNYNLFAALKLERTMMFIVLVIIIVIATFNIAGSLIMVSVSRSRDCGIMRAVGATKKQISMMFNFKGMMIGLLGAAAGSVIGVILALVLRRYEFIQLPPQVYLVSTLPVRINPADIVIIVLTTVAVSFLATLYPAYRAGHMEVADELRYE